MHAGHLYDLYDIMSCKQKDDQGCRVGCRANLALPIDSALEGGQMPARVRRYGSVRVGVGHLLFVSRLLEQADGIVVRAGHLLPDLMQGNVQL